MEIIRETRLEGVLPERISFNYEELKNELDERLKVYQGKEKTDASNYKERKADRARLNDLARSLNDDRKQLKQQLLSPLTNGTPEHISYSDQIDQLIGSIKMVVGEIDAGIKEYEDGLREAKRTDIIAALKLGGEKQLIAFCERIQSGSPVDSFATPEPWDMPGYDSQVIMAAGAFTMGASIELSADAPLREPYAVWLQGGLTFPTGKAGIMLAAQSMIDKGLANI